VQPSGGPYGPIHQKYEIPKNAAHVYYVAPDGQADAPGTAVAQPTTLEAAITRVVTGDAIVLRGGVYRTGGLELNQGITLQPYADERPVLKGTQVPTKWEALRNNVWRTPWTRLFPARPLGWWRRDREGMRTPLHRFNNDMVFVDGEMLKSAGWEGELDKSSYFIDYEAGQVYIGVDPKGPPGRDHRLRQRSRPDQWSRPRQDVGSQGAGHPWHHVHAVCLPRARGGRKEALHCVRRAHRRAGGPGRSLDVREGSRGHHPGERHDLLLLPRGRLFPRGQPDDPPVAHQ
jgi:hypothetical protein